MEKLVAVYWTEGDYSSVQHIIPFFYKSDLDFLVDFETFLLEKIEYAKTSGSYPVGKFKIGKYNLDVSDFIWLEKPSLDKKLNNWDYNLPTVFTLEKWFEYYV